MNIEERRTVREFRHRPYGSVAELTFLATRDLDRWRHKAPRWECRCALLVCGKELYDHSYHVDEPTPEVIREAWKALLAKFRKDAADTGECDVCGGDVK